MSARITLAIAARVLTQLRRDHRTLAMLLVLPMLLSFQGGGEIFRAPIVSGVMIAVSASLMVSRLPTPSIKYMRPARHHRVLVWAFVGLLAGFMITWPWITATVGMAHYLMSIPVGIAMQARRARTHPGE